MVQTFEPTYRNMQNSEAPSSDRQQSKAPPNLPSLNPSNGWFMQAPVLKRSSSQPTTTSELYVSDGRPSYASVLKARLANMKRAKATQTNESDFISTEELEWFGLPATISHPPVFPVDNYIVHYPRLLAPIEQLNFALYPPTSFPEEHWEEMWQKGTLILDLHIATTIPTLSEICRSPSDIYFRTETEFTGFDYRVKIDESRCHKPLVIKTGDIVDILKVNKPDGRYIVDLCQMIRNGRAYIPVHYRDYYGQGFTKTSDPRHPSFILDIPESFCHSRVAFRLRSNAIYYASLLPPLPIIKNIP